jgi:hypothetical protein
MKQEKWGCAAIALALAACSSNGLGRPAGGTMPQTVARTWMSPEAKKADLLYVTDIGDNDVDVFTYPHGTQVGTLSGFNYPNGACVDKKGDIFITNKYPFGYTTPPEIIEYAHGGTTPVATLGDSSGSPNDCSVDASSGSLAVATIEGSDSSAGSVSIYQDAKGSPTTYAVPGIYSVFSCAYDADGDLFADGGATRSGGVQLAELSKHAKTFVDLSMDANIASAGGLQWDGKYLAIVDNTNNIVYQLTIAGSSATVVGQTDLEGSWGSEQIAKFTVPHSKKTQGKVLIGPNVNSNGIGFWPYPAGGSPKRTINSFVSPLAAAVSKGRKGAGAL